MMTTYNKPMCPVCKKLDNIKQYKYIGKVIKRCSNCFKKYNIRRIKKYTYRCYTKPNTENGGIEV